MDERQRLTLAWADFSRRMRWNHGCVLGGFLVLAISAFALDGTEKLGNALMSGLIVAWILVVVGTGLHVQQFRCPHCGLRFLGQYGWAPHRCQNCGAIRGALTRKKASASGR